MAINKVSTGGIAANAVTTSKIANDAVGVDDLANAINANIATGVAAGTTANNSLPKAGGQMTGNITMSGSQTVDGRDLSADGSKLDGVETSAKDDQTGAQIKTLYQAETNAFTDAKNTKLGNIETAATADQTNTEIKTAVQAASSIALGGNPTTTTQSESDNSTKLATTAYVTSKITTLIGGAPSTLNDLNELAEAINDDDNYNSTLTTALGTKLPKAGGTMTGTITSTHATALQLTNNTTNKIHFGDSGNASIGKIEYVHSSNHLAFKVNDAERMRIISDGKVGIGTTSPSHPLDVTGDARATRLIGSGVVESSSGVSGDTWAVMGVNTSNSAGRGGAVFGSKHADSNALLVGTHDATFNSFVVKGNGRVGIGTFPPSGASNSSYKQLFVNTGGALVDSGGSGPATMVLNNSYVGAGNNNYATATQTAARIVMTSGRIHLDTAPSVSANAQQTFTTRVRVNANGDVGFNKNPIRALDIKAGGDPGIRLESASHSADVITLRNSDGRVGFGGDSLVVKSNNVVIGQGVPLGVADNSVAKLGVISTGTTKIDVASSGANAQARIDLADYTVTSGESSSINFYKSHNNTLNAKSNVVDGEQLGTINFSGVSRTNANFNRGGFIKAKVNGSIGSTYVPTDITIGTNDSGTDRTNTPQIMVSHTGAVGISTNTPMQTLHVSGQTRLSGAGVINDHNMHNDTVLEVRGTHMGNGTVDPDAVKLFKLALNDNTEYGGQAQFSLGRWEENGSNARSSLVISLGHGAQSSSSNADADVMTLTSNKVVLINRTSSSSGAHLQVNHVGASQYAIYLNSTSGGSGTHYHMTFNRGDTQAGYLVSSPTTIGLANSSDERLKENIQDSASATQSIKNIKVRQFDWKNNRDVHKYYGFVAQELVTVVPEAVAVGSEELNEDGTPVQIWGVDDSKIIPRLVKTIQELEARITALEA